MLSVLLENLPPAARPAGELIDAAKELDQHYIPTRYPNGFERGPPADFHRNPVTLVTPIVSTSGIKVYLVTRSHRIASRNHERRIS